jgi:protein CpxP
MTLSFYPPLRRSVAIASLAGASLALGVVGASAQTSTTTKPGSTTPPAAAAATSSKPQTVEQRISMLKTELKITPDQEPKWDKVATAMRENAAAMDKLVKDKQAKEQNITAVDDLKTYQDFTQAHLDGLKNLTSAFESLYDSMPADQKKHADQVFHDFGPSKTRKQG